VYIRVLEGKLRGNDHLGDLGLDGGDNIEMDNKKRMGCLLDWSGSRQGQVAGSCECSGPIKCGV
jgi:hypothetical protein